MSIARPSRRALLMAAAFVPLAGSYVTGKVLEVDGGIDAPDLDLGLPNL